MATRPAVVMDPEAGIPDLIRRLVDDSKRLAQDEVRLAKMELRENVHDATRGGIWLGVAFGAGVVALIALTVCLAALIGRALNFHYWAGTLIVAVVELAVGGVLVMRGLKAIKQQPLTLPETRAEAAETARWVQQARDPLVREELADGARRSELLAAGNPPRHVQTAPRVPSRVASETTAPRAD